MKKFPVLALAAVVLLAVYYEGGMPKIPAEKSVPPAASKALVTFVELGSVNFIPCRAMQPVMRDPEKKFGDQIRMDMRPLSFLARTCLNPYLVTVATRRPDVRSWIYSS